ncbi:hypothetical protein [Cupriavidus sp. AcVe19-6a]|uniref:hypothetical protein n=1 Tax=Cupriavidus sp. AcVe19-6a TaxID=2821358 RepID=UPI001AE581A8|nr:hypothetical protein [Cupriavidus sp. AcVe19-6a]MBP0639962.1 hypothetical protein [Cupriavidus sp. AcVe19-6a]
MNSNNSGNVEQGGQLPNSAVTAAPLVSQPKSYRVAVHGGDYLERAPRVAKFQVTETYAREIVRLAALVVANDLYQVERLDGRASYMQFDPETDPDDAQEAGEDNSVRTECDVLVVSKDEFLFEAYVKHTDARVKCTAQPIAELAAHFANSLDEANQPAPDSTAASSQHQGPDLVGVLSDLVQAVEFTPLGVRGITAVRSAKAALGEVPGSGYAKLAVQGRFAATWSEAFTNGPETRTVTGDFFTLGAGYDWEDIVGLAALGVGQTWEDRHYGPAHTVMRLPDTE